LNQASNFKTDKQKFFKKRAAAKEFIYSAAAQQYLYGNFFSLLKH